MAKRKLQPKTALLLRIEQAFLDHGYGELSMIGLAQACEFTTRSLYNYFDNKEDAFRAVVLYRNEESLSTGLAAGWAQRTEGGTALDIFAAIMDIRFGETRRLANASPHVAELSAEVSKRCNDIVTASAVAFQAELAKLILELQAEGLLHLRGNATPKQVAQALADGARGVNQHLPPVAPDGLADRYRLMCRFVLYGCAEMPLKVTERTGFAGRRKASARDSGAERRERDGA
jgi:AcrR family transcriptional regulator